LAIETEHHQDNRRAIRGWAVEASSRAHEI